MKRTSHIAQTRRFLATLCGILLLAAGSWARPQKATAPPPQTPTSNAEFLKTADEVLTDMSKLLSLPVVEPLKKSIRSRDQIREYLIHSMHEDKDEAKRKADQKSLEAFGLIPQGYPLDQKMLALLTEQIAGLYDPKGREFFIADWTSPADQQIIMAHELTHALQDQHFHIQKWEDSVKSNDDATLARDAVLEGSATVAMIDYYLLQKKIIKNPYDIFEVPGLDPSLLLGDPNDSPELSSAPLAIREEMLFPYFFGFSFIDQVIKTWDGWPALHKLFENPPVSSQQIMHPDLYLRGVVPQTVSLAPVLKAVPRGWKKLDENVVGEFFLRVILKQFLGDDRAEDLSPSWAGDRYAVYQQGNDGPTLLIYRLRLQNDAETARFFGGYSQVLEQKHESRTALLRSPNYFSFDTPSGGVFLRCAGSECLTVEGATKQVFEAMTRSIGWPAGSPATVPDSPAGNGNLVGIPGRSMGVNAWLAQEKPANPAAAFTAR